MSESMKPKEQQLGLGRHLMMVATVTVDDNKPNKNHSLSLWRSERLRYDIMSSWNLIYDRTAERLYGKIHIKFIRMIIIKGRPSNYKIMNIWVPYRRDHLYELNYQFIQRMWKILYSFGDIFYITVLLPVCFLGMRCDAMGWRGRWLIC